MTRLPRVVVAGTRSGAGKTSVATGLMAALRRTGLRVAGAKVGPDFIDPGYHAIATGRPPRNLDPFLHGANRVAGLLLHGAGAADVAVVEGVLGLFDGRDGGDEASTAHVARLLHAPVVLVVDAGGMSRSVAAEVHGFTTFDPSVHVAGVIVNRVASDSHEQSVREALRPLGIPVLGVLRRSPDLATPARHLGLVPAVERTAAAGATVAALADAVAAGIDLAGVLAAARNAPPLDAPAWDPAAAVQPDIQPVHRDRPLVAVAAGPAFSFTYTEHRELLAAAGAEVVSFDPLTAEDLPTGTVGLLLGGGFPETYAEDLSANVPVRRAVAAFARAGGPVVAECGGLVYLCRAVDGVPLTGVLDLEARFTPRLNLGYREVSLRTSGPLGRARSRARAHEFHRTTVEPPTAEPVGTRPLWDVHRPGKSPEPEGFAVRNVAASYLHTSWVGSPALARAFVTTARQAAARLHSAVQP